MGNILTVMKQPICFMRLNISIAVCHMHIWLLDWMMPMTFMIQIVRTLLTLSTYTLQQRCHALMGKNSKTYMRRMVLLHIYMEQYKQKVVEMVCINNQEYRLGVARPFLMLEAFFLTLP